VAVAPWLTSASSSSKATCSATASPSRQRAAPVRFISIDLDQARAFETVPWVRQATLRRIWPDRLAVHLDEHQPVALWLGDAATSWSTTVRSSGQCR
jgi:hypothetical protein